MNSERLLKVNEKLKEFVSDSLGIKNRERSLSLDEINFHLLSACVYNTYIETISNKSDTIFRYIKESDTSCFTISFHNYIGQIAKKINLHKKKVVLAFDYTTEVFWGEVEGLNIMGTGTSEKGTGAFKFLTCSQVSGKIHAKIPLISIPVHLGHNKTHAITYCLSLIRKYIGEIELILFDREFYIKDLMMSLNELKIPYLIFVPKKEGFIKKALSEMYVGETKTIVRKFKVNKNKTVYHDKTTMTFLKEIFDGKDYEHFDWCFVTNIDDFDVDKMIPVYKCRWRIETGFRIQDEADSKTKSKEMSIRYFFFLYEQLLQTIWYVFFFKEENMNFKQFIITLLNFAKEKGSFEGSKVHLCK